VLPIIRLNISDNNHDNNDRLYVKQATTIINCKLAIQFVVFLSNFIDVIHLYFV
jgi:hypothetical protein